MALVALAEASRGNPVPLQWIARQESIPESYLQQLFLRLRKKNLVKSVRGPGGGFILARPPSEISVGEIVRTAEGKPATVGCRQSGRQCNMINKCRTQGMWDALEWRIEEFLDSMSLDDLFDRRPAPAREMRA
jgi:Rrf2 family iron-sulfur cluster assembly transcriptional regulator